MVGTLCRPRHMPSQSRIAYGQMRLLQEWGLWPREHRPSLLTHGAPPGHCGPLLDVGYLYASPTRFLQSTRPKRRALTPMHCRSARIDPSLYMNFSVMTPLLWTLSKPLNHFLCPLPLAATTGAGGRLFRISSPYCE